MSMEQSIDPALIEQTKMQIRNLVNEIRDLSKSESTPEAYFAEFLPRVVSALAAVGGAIWLVDEQGRLGLQYQINLQETGLRENQQAQIQHGRLLQRVMASGESSLAPPRSGFEEGEEGGNPTDYLLILGPVRTELETVALIEVFQRPGAGPKTQSGYLNFLNQVTALATDFFKTRQLRHFGDRQTLWTQLEEFTRVIHTSLEPSATAYTIANEGRRLIECDRVSLAIRRGGKCKVEAVSGQDLFDKRSNLVRLMGELATAVVRSEEPLWYTGSTEDMAPQIEDAIEEYVDESHSKTVAVIPLFPPTTPEQETDDLDEKEAMEPPFGALIVEQIEDSRVPDKMRKRIDVVVEHSRLAMSNSLEHNSLFLMPLWRAIGKSKVVLKAKNLPKTVSITIAVIAAIIGMIVIPWDFEMVSDGSLQPVTERKVFANVDEARVKDILVRHDQRVDEGQLLCTLDSQSLQLAIIENQKRLQSNQDQLATTANQLIAAEGRLTPGEEAGLRGKLAELQSEWIQLDAESRLLRKQMEDLEVRAPIAGVVMTWNVHNLLKDRPVRRGAKLMEIANPDGDWHVELMMPDRRIGEIKRWRNSQSDEPIEVEFVLATDPDKTFTGVIASDQDIHQLAEVRGEEGNTVLIKVAISEEELERMNKELGAGVLHPGASVSAKVKCGKQPLGYVLLYDALAYLRKNILFRL